MRSVLFIGHNYYPELTGIGKYTAEFANFLAKDPDNKVTVCTGNPYYPKWKVFEGYRNRWFTKEKVAGVKVYRAPLYIPQQPTGAKRLLQDALFFACVLGMIHYFLLFKRQRFDAVFIAVPSFMLGFAGLYYRFFHRQTQVLYHIQDLQVDAAEQLGIIKNRSLLALLYRMERFILQRVDQVSIISTGMRTRVLAKTPKLDECLLFPNWINNDVIYPIRPQPAPPVAAFRDKKVCFYSGAIGEKQGLEMILEAATRLQAHTDLLFVISGEGPYKLQLEKKAEELQLRNICFMELLPLEQFNQMLNSAFVHLVIQKESGSDLFLPSKLTNILGVGGCAIVTAARGTSLYELVTENNCGIVIPPSDANALVDAILTLDRNPCLKQSCSAHAIAYARKYLDKEQVIGKYLREIGWADSKPVVIKQGEVAFDQ